MEKSEQMTLTIGQLKNLLKDVPSNYLIGINRGSEGVSGIKIKTKRSNICWLVNDTTNFGENFID
jgi:hypothetical protein